MAQDESITLSNLTTTFSDNAGLSGKQVPYLEVDLGGDSEYTSVFRGDETQISWQESITVNPGGFEGLRDRLKVHTMMSQSKTERSQVVLQSAKARGK